MHNSSVHLHFVGVCFVFILFVPGLAIGDVSPDVRGDLEEFNSELRESGHTHFGRGLLDRGLEGYDKLRSVANESGFDWSVGASYLYQAHDRGDGNQWTNNIELDVYMAWENIVDSARFGKGSLTYLSSHVWETRNFTGFGSGATTSEVTDTLGSVFKVSAGTLGSPHRCRAK